MPSPRDHIETHTFAPPAGGTLATIETALLSILAAAERHSAGTPAATAFTAAIRRKGEELITISGEALDDVLACIRAAAPEKAPQRERLLDAAWAGLFGWWR